MKIVRDYRLIAFIIFIAGMGTGFISCGGDENGKPKPTPTPTTPPHTTLRWECTDPDPGDVLTFDVYFEAENPVPNILVARGIEEFEYDPGQMEYGTTYYWQIVAKDSTGNITAGPVWRFTTAGARASEGDFVVIRDKKLKEPITGKDVVNFKKGLNFYQWEPSFEAIDVNTMRFTAVEINSLTYGHSPNTPKNPYPPDGATGVYPNR